MAFLLLILVIPLTILYGWVLSLLWSWFFTPIFGLPQLRIVEAIGVMVVIGFIRFRYQSKSKTDEDDTVSGIVTSFIMPFIFLSFGWIVKSFM